MKEKFWKERKDSKESSSFIFKILSDVCTLSMPHVLKEIILHKLIESPIPLWSFLFVWENQHISGNSGFQIGTGEL